MLYRSLIGATALAATWMACSAQAQDLSKYPDWSGQWKNTSGIQWDQTNRSAAPAGPADAGYQARYEANLADQTAGGWVTTRPVNASRTACRGHDMVYR